MPNLITSQQALEALQAGPCRVAREGWEWGKWIESIKLADGNLHICVFSDNNLCHELLWEPEFADHSAADWYVLEERV